MAEDRYIEESSSNTHLNANRGHSRPVDGEYVKQTK